MAACSLHFPETYPQLYKNARTERIASDVQNEKLAAASRLESYNELLAYAPETAAKLRSLIKKIEADKRTYDAKMLRLKIKNETERKRQAKSQGVSIGMSKQQVLESSWGKPKDINRTVTAYGTNEQCVYDGGYLYFDGDLLTTVQN